MEDDWEPSKTYNISHTPGSFFGIGANPSQNGELFHFGLKTILYIYIRLNQSINASYVCVISGVQRFEVTSEDQEIALVGGLHPAVTYKFRVFAINTIDTSEPTGPAVAKTQEEG